MSINRLNLNQNIDRAVVEAFDKQIYKKSRVQLFVKRDDLIHKEISGNKWRKLKKNLKAAKHSKCEIVATYGGAYSNHLLATACAGNEFNIKTKGFVRGEELNKKSNPILKRCTELGMELLFISRKEYVDCKGTNGAKVFNNELTWYIPEGGANKEGVEGCKEIMRETSNDFDYVFVAQGTTTTSMGILSSLNVNTKLVVVPVLKGFNSTMEMRNMAQKFNLFYDESRIIVLDGYHFGGYAKANSELNYFIEQFNQNQNFRIEACYTGKVMYALIEFIKTEKLKNKKVLLVHTGGLYNNQFSV